ncbi:35690_t:CDS:1, partial [Racocetra persica]
MGSEVVVEELIRKKNINNIYYNEFGNFEKISDIGYFYISKAEWKNFKINVAVKAVKGLIFDQYSYKILIKEVAIHDNDMLKLLAGNTGSNNRQFIATICQ